MGLLFHNLSEDFQHVADDVYEQHFIDDPQMEKEYSDYRKRKMYEDVLHNLSFLEVSYRLNDPKIFHEYAIWLLELMIHLMPDLTESRVKDQMIKHYELLHDALEKTLDNQAFKEVKIILDDAIETTKTYQAPDELPPTVHDTYHVYKKTYLDYLLNEQSKQAIDYIIEIKQSGLSLNVIYEDILQPVMETVGKLWHKNKITVDKEHYITSITQTAMSQFYQDIFSSARKNHTLLACSVGSELHEMGARMVSDLFEYNGWDSTYLGAAVPDNVLLKNIETHHPDLVVLSVTMPQHLPLCYDLVKKINALDTPPKIAVGGRAFSLTNNIWKHWPVDISTTTAKELVTWAESAFAV